MSDGQSGVAPTPPRKTRGPRKSTLRALEAEYQRGVSDGMKMQQDGGGAGLAVIIAICTAAGFGLGLLF